MCLLLQARFIRHRNDDKFLDWAKKAIQAASNATMRGIFITAYASEINNNELAEKYLHHLGTTSPNFIKDILDDGNIVFSEQQSNERLVNGRKIYITTLS